MGVVERLLGRLVEANDRHIAWIDPVSRNPRRVDDQPWHLDLVDRLPELTAEWQAFTETDGRLPHIEDVLGEHQGNNGPWRVGVLLTNGVPTRLGTREFPATLAALRRIPGLRAALWSVLEPGTELEEHEGPNAGVLRYHLGVACTPGAVLRVGGREVPYENGVGILFDDTQPHSAWNHGDSNRVTLFCEIDRPLPRGGRLRNRAVQSIIGLAPRRRGIVALADEWDSALNVRRSTPELRTAG